MKILLSFLFGVIFTAGAVAGLYFYYIQLNYSNVATADDVALGKIFLINPIQKQIGSYIFAGRVTPTVDYALQQQSAFDDYRGPLGSKSIDEDFQSEESIWVNTGTNVWTDTRTSLYWSSKQASYSNKFVNNDSAVCDSFTTKNRGSYTGEDVKCGDAINYCAKLALDTNDDGVQETDWYLPSQKELQQAYIDGMFNQTAPGLTPLDLVWSASEVSTNSNAAWAGSLATGAMSGDNLKTKLLPVYCVTRIQPL